jgi:hypothetical protein
MKAFHLAFFAALWFATPSAISQTSCSPKGFDICHEARQFASWLNSEQPRSGKHFRVARAEQRDGSITVYFVFLAGEEGLEKLLRETRKTKAEFDISLKQISADAACKNPARRIVTNGGSFMAVYEYPDRSKFYSHTVTACE